MQEHVAGGACIHALWAGSENNVPPVQLSQGTRFLTVITRHPLLNPRVPLSSSCLPSPSTFSLYRTTASPSPSSPTSFGQQRQRRPPPARPPPVAWAALGAGASGFL